MGFPIGNRDATSNLFSDILDTLLGDFDFDSNFIGLGISQVRFYFDSNELESAEFKIVLIRFGFDWALSAKRKVEGKKNSHVQNKKEEFGMNSTVIQQKYFGVSGKYIKQNYIYVY